MKSEAKPQRGFHSSKPGGTSTAPACGMQASRRACSCSPYANRGPHDVRARKPHVNAHTPMPCTHLPVAAQQRDGGASHLLWDAQVVQHALRMRHTRTPTRTHTYTHTRIPRAHRRRAAPHRGVTQGNGMAGSEGKSRHDRTAARHHHDRSRACPAQPHAARSNPLPCMHACLSSPPVLASQLTNALEQCEVRCRWLPNALTAAAAALAAAAAA